MPFFLYQCFVWSVFLSLVEYAVILRRIVGSRKKKNKKREQVRYSVAEW